jgi:hypothetical protein
MKIEEIFEVDSIQKYHGTAWESIPAQFTHFKNIKKPNQNLPMFSSLMVVLPLGLTSAGKKFKVIIEEI